MEEKTINYKGFKLERTIGSHKVSMSYFERVGPMNQSMQTRHHYEYRFVGCDSPYNMPTTLDCIKDIIANAENPRLYPWFVEWIKQRESQRQ